MYLILFFSHMHSYCPQIDNSKRFIIRLVFNKFLQYAKICLEKEIHILLLLLISDQV